MSEVPECPFYTKIGRQNTLNLYTFQGATSFMVTDAFLKMQNPTAGVKKYSSLHSSLTFRTSETEICSQELFFGVFFCKTTHFLETVVCQK